MRDDYLWDGSGEPDPEIQKMESTLGGLRHQRPAPEFPEIVGRKLKRRWFFPAMQPRFFAGATACVALLAVATTWLWLLQSNSNPVVPSEWNITQVQGSAMLAGRRVRVFSGTHNLRVGEVLQTNDASKASLRAEGTGEIELEPNTRLRVVKSSSGSKRLMLEYGTIQATIWAEPGEFVVDTPSAVAVDLGCIYTLKVDGSGDGLLRTTLGWVGFKLKDRESFIPAGAACATRRKTGPGTPYFEDAPPTFLSAVAQFDSYRTQEDRSAALAIILEQSRPRDALTLWHLLPRVSASDRGRVYDRLAQLVAPPAQVTREGVLRLDPQMLDLWWNELDLGDVSLWRHWERSWSPGR